MILIWYNKYGHRNMTEVSNIMVVSSFTKKDTYIDEFTNEHIPIEKIMYEVNAYLAPTCTLGNVSVGIGKDEVSNVIIPFIYFVIEESVYNTLLAGYVNGKIMMSLPPNVEGEFNWTE